MIDQIQRKATRLCWQSVFVAEATGVQTWPLRLPLRLQPPRDLQAYEAWFEELHAGASPQRVHSYTIELTERSTRGELGRQSIPTGIFFADAPSFFGFLGLSDDLRDFRTALAAIGSHIAAGGLPDALRQWALEHAQEVLKHRAVWSDLLVVCAYFFRNPVPDCYIRELPIPVDTKFIESYKGVLSQLLPLVLPLGVWQEGEKHFEDKLGLRRPPARVRMRVLDPKLAAAHLAGLRDVELPIADLAGLPLAEAVRVVLVAENLQSVEVLAATLPETPGALVLWGAGGAAARLKRVPWLHDVPRLLYWGDLDAHGFAILAEFRRSFPRAEAFLMSPDLFKEHHQLVSGKVLAKSHLEGLLSADALLTDPERAALEWLQAHGLRLEQEKLSHQQVLEAWRGLGLHSS